MDLRNLNTFIQVAESGSFTRAGEALGYSQPTISFQIKQLEQELAVPLFDRIGHTVRLTDEGRAALRYAQQICHLSEEMTAAKESQVNTQIRMAMADSLCSPLVTRGFPDFHERHPHISINITTAGTAGLFRLLDHNEVDLVCTLDSRIHNTSYIIAHEEKVGVHFVVSSHHPLAKAETVTLSQLISHPFLLTEKGMSYRRLLDERLAQSDLEIHPILELGSAEVLCTLCAEGTGVAFLPDYVTEKAVQKGALTRLKTEDFQLEVWKQVLYRRDKWVSLQMQSVVDHLSHNLLKED